MKYNNFLAHESSPYLLQHAHNPVNWYPWCNKAFAKAREENKLVILSIGYSSCHWCHVMEKQSFENEDIARVMNDCFVSVKVDREERPDIDQVYMNAVQLMNGSGGWPLNCITLPDGRPVYGGTYFPPQKWKEVLLGIHTLFLENPDRLYKYAEELTAGVKRMEHIIKTPVHEDMNVTLATEAAAEIKKSFDRIHGGLDRSPKFPMPSVWQFLLHYGYAASDDESLAQVRLTLRKMAMGGIYDQLGGGFARYSTDSRWKVPHFEKMLYDNAQLLSLYSDAFRATGETLYKQVVYETIDFLEKDMSAPSGGFYSAIDADSEGEEGKYYVWKKEDLEQLLGEDFKIFSAYYSVNSGGYWENGNYILFRNENMDAADSLMLSRLKKCREKLISERIRRIPPATDTKVLTSWNAITVKALADAFSAFGEHRFLQRAQTAAGFILHHLVREDGSLLHSAPSPESAKALSGSFIPGFLEDYCFTIEAFIALYQCTSEESWLAVSKQLADYVLEHFYDKKSGMCWFTPRTGEQLFAKNMEVQDNVIPSSNSSMAKNFLILGIYYQEENYISVSNRMLQQLEPSIKQFPQWYSGWARLLLLKSFPLCQVVVTGKNADAVMAVLREKFLPGVLLAGCRETTTIPLLRGKPVKNQSLIYVCRNNTCMPPVTTTEDALKLISEDW